MMDLASKISLVFVVIGSQLPVQTLSLRTCSESGGTLIGPPNAIQCLTFSDVWLSWDGAKKACNANNEQLASLADPQAVFDYVNTTYGNVVFWVGGSDTRNEDSWEWLNGNLIEELPWGKGQPFGAKRENCLGLDGDYGYDDWRCTARLRYICEISDCEDKSKNCLNWVDECEKQSYYMHTFCRKTCKQCDMPPPARYYTSTTELSVIEATGPCEDENDLCSHWADVGECEVNPNSMHKTCKKSCKKCGCSEGFLKLDGSTECFKIYDDVERTWEESKSHCEANGYRMASPSNSVAVALRKELLDINDKGNDVWINARGNGSQIIWQDSNTVMKSNNSLWLGGGHGIHIATDQCVFMLVSEKLWKSQPDRPYAVGFCQNGESRFTLCEAI